MSKNGSQIDLSKYRTPELIGKLTEILSLGGAFVGLLLTLGIVVFLIEALLIWMVYDHVDQTWLIGIAIWGFLSGVVSGFALGFARLVHGGLKNLASVLELMLNMVEMAAGDFENLKSGQHRPTVAELTAAMHQQVFEPCLLIVLEKSLGWFAGPVKWFYKSSLGRAVALLLMRLDGADTTVEPDNKGMELTPETYEKTLAVASKYSGLVKAVLRPAHAAVSGFGFVFRWVVVWPLYAFFFSCLAGSIIPVVLIRFFAD